MRTISLETVRDEIRTRFGRKVRSNRTTLRHLKEVTGCRAMANNTFIVVEIESLVSVPGTAVWWINQDVVSRKAEELHRKYYYNDPKCHIYRDTLYCVCPQETIA